ncbi:MAG: PASTA domain-containing protein [Bacilli bacterium]|nr:PASTA domain-containing protein [Bacilli bacterium]
MAKEKEIKEKKTANIFIGLFLIIALGCSGFAIYELLLLSSIETLIRFIVIGIICILDLYFITKANRIIKGKIKKKKSVNKGLFITILFIYSIICFLVGGIIFYVYGKIDSLNKNTVTYTSKLLVMNNNAATDIDDINEMTIGILDDQKNPEGYIIPQEIIRENKLQDENEIKKYDDYTSMLVDLYANELDAMFVSGSYVSMFSGITGYENIEIDTKVIISKDKKMKKAATSSIETASSGKSITEPFTILLMGIDSTDEVLEKNAIANGDTLILITFNPKTLNATMISIPRDSYVPIACWSGKPENKITHAAAYGNDCMINTIQNYFDTKIDYYAKINFKGLVKLVNAVGGVEVDVPQVLCTDDSSRGGEICIQPGRQVLNGEQALVFARNRKALANGDFGRAQHQQEIIMALVNKMKNIKDVSKFMEILNTISNSLDTNLTTKQILSFYNVGKDIIKKSLSSDDADLINIQQLFLQGTGQMIYDERARMVLWDYVPINDSRKDIIQAMKENLELANHNIIKEFSFSINEPYEKEIIGKGPYKKTGTYTLLPDFTGDSEATARAYALKNGISVTFKGSGGTVISQSYPANKRVDLIKGSVVLTLSGSIKQDTNDSDKVIDKKPVKPNNDKDDKDDEDDDIKDNDDKNENNNPSIDVPESSLPTE